MSGVAGARAGDPDHPASTQLQGLARKWDDAEDRFKFGHEEIKLCCGIADDLIVIKQTSDDLHLFVGKVHMNAGNPDAQRNPRRWTGDRQKNRACDLEELQK